MSNYINVLRRLERERRLPDPESMPTSAPSVAPPVVPPPPMPSTSEIAVPTALPEVVVRPPVEPPPVVSPVPIERTIVAPAPESTTIATRENAAPAPRTIIPLPTVTAQPLTIPADVTPPPVAIPSPTAPVARSHDTRRSRAFATEAHPGIAMLLESIRLIANGRARRVVVFCGASTAEAVTTLAQDLAEHADRSGLTPFVGALFRSASGTIIAAANDAAASAQAVDLDAGLTVETFGAWIDRVAPRSDLVVMTGPPLATSIDAALLACACDGLVIVAESEVTERAALQVAAERARIAGCKTLGVVMHGTKDRLPGWIRRFVGTSSHHHS